ncbi:GntR family transcriptional regulator [Streptomyces sp. WAC 05379]|uniref:GntR family transcriptional regulator n=1 Tax=Streptomyces sp. WAC 05379 TaxID=2203207 RepID=UPI000F745354|nr:GntR family transcriptional regulator [Streptomyces sp. WAC 05379]RSN91150.1 GntR family transcriptional regulator [Streptomyces sp. WAC 05379]
MTASKRLPRSREVADELRREIESGELAPGSVLPSERELVERFSISSGTASKVVALLKSTGLVESQVGRGVFVKKRTQLIRHAHDRYARRWREAGKAPFRTEVEAQGRTANVEVTSIERVTPPRWVAERLALPPSAQVVRRENTYRADGRVVQLVTTYIPLSIAGDTSLEEAVPGPGGIYAAFEQLGHRLSRMLEEVQARMPRYEETERLGAESGTPVLDVVHISYDQDETPMDVSHFVLRADENVLTYELPTD